MLPAEEHNEMFASNFLLVAINKNDVTTKLSSNYVTYKTITSEQNYGTKNNLIKISALYQINTNSWALKPKKQLLKKTAFREIDSIPLAPLRLRYSTLLNSYLSSMHKKDPKL